MARLTKEKRDEVDALVLEAVTVAGSPVPLRKLVDDLQIVVEVPSRVSAALQRLKAAGKVAIKRQAGGWYVPGAKPTRKAAKRSKTFGEVFDQERMLRAAKRGGA